MAHLVVLPDLPDELAERLIDVDAVLRRGLNELAAEVLRKVTTLCRRNLFSTCALPRKDKVTYRSFPPAVRTPNHTCLRQR